MPVGQQAGPVALCAHCVCALQTDRQNILAKYFAPDVLTNYFEDYFVKCSQRIILVYISTKFPGKAPPDHYRRPRQGGHGFNHTLGDQGHSHGSSAARYNPCFPRPPNPPDAGHAATGAEIPRANSPAHAAAADAGPGLFATAASTFWDATGNP